MLSDISFECCVRQVYESSLALKPFHMSIHPELKASCPFNPPLANIVLVPKLWWPGASLYIQYKLLREYYQLKEANAIILGINEFKGTVSRVFLLLVFFMNQFAPSPRVIRKDRFEFFRKFAEIFASLCAPPVSTTPTAKFSTIFPSVDDIGGKFATGINDTGGKQGGQ
jgi:hypothetical protein